MSSYVATPLTSNIGLTPEHYLICRGVPIARSGWQKYRGWELGLVGDDRVYKVFRPPSEVFSKKAMASAEGKALTALHPGQMLDASNTSWHQRGHIQNVRRGPRDANGDDLLLADLVVTDSKLADDILSGRLREISLGYSCLYQQIAEDEFLQQNISVNHAAVVYSARAGSSVSIRDSKETEMTKEGKELIRKIRAIERSVDQDSLAHKMVESAEMIEDITNSGGHVSTFAEALARQNPAYASFAEAQRVGQEFSEQMKEAGRQMGARYRPCRDSARR